MWVEFYFNSNSAWGLIDSPQAFEHIVDLLCESTEFRTRAQAEEHVLRASDCPASTRPNFGYYREHSGHLDLGEWMVANGNMALLEAHQTQRRDDRDKWRNGKGATTRSGCARERRWYGVRHNGV